jgi:hypothetical protein
MRGVYFAAWKSWAERRRLRLLRMAVGGLEQRTLTQLEHRNDAFERLSLDMRGLMAQVQQLVHFSGRNATHGPTAHEPLLSVTSRAVAGVGSFPDLCMTLSNWVLSVEASQRKLFKSIQEIWDWARIVDEEIHRVQRFSRPVFKA